MAFTFPQLVHRDNKDLGIMLLGYHMSIEDIDPSVQDRAVQGILQDVTGDSEVHVTIRQFQLTDEDGQDFYTLQAFAADMATGESRLYLFEKDCFKYFAEEEILLGLEKDLGEGLYDGAGNLVALPLKNTSLADEMGLQVPENTFVAVRAITPTEEKEKGVEEKQENALRLFRALTN